MSFRRRPESAGRTRLGRGMRMLARGFVFRHQLLIIVLLSLLAAAAAEVVLHLQPLPRYVADMIYVQAADLDVHRPMDDPKLMYSLRPNTQVVFRNPHRPPRTVTVNSLGLRDPERSVRKPPGVFRIFMGGCSTIYGAEVEDDQTLAAYLERELNAHAPAGRKYEVWNGGVSAYTPTQVVASARRVAAMGAEPDVYLLHILLLSSRAFLNQHIDVAKFAVDPSLFAEHFYLPPAWRGIGAFLCGHSRLAMLLTAHYNRMLGQQHRQELVHPIQVENHRRAVQAFAAEFGARAKIAAFVAPCSQEGELTDARLMAQSTSLPTWCLNVQETGPEYKLLHPPPHVYADWARRMAGYLETNDGFH